jgi:hypothetical protein
MLRKLSVFALLLTLMPFSAFAGDGSLTAGGDRYRSGMNVSVSEPLERDGLLSGFSVSVNGKVAKDVHAFGAYVNIAAPIGGDAYLTGMTVTVTNAIGDDLTAAAANIQVEQNAVVSGNARLAGANIVLDGTIDGALLAAAANIEINGVVKGDAQLTGGELTFGPAAKIEGVLTYSAGAPLTIPDSVVPAARVRFEKLEASRTFDGIDKMARDYREHYDAGWGGALFAFLSGLVFLGLVGALLLWLLPLRVEALVSTARTLPVKTGMAGMLGLAVILGMIPVSAMTLVGIPLIPFLLLLAVVAWLAGYLLGVYAAAKRTAQAFGRDSESFGGRLLILLLGLAVFTVFNFIPYLGWLVNVLAVFVGLGTMTVGALAWFTRWTNESAGDHAANDDRPQPVA